MSGDATLPLELTRADHDLFLECAGRDGRNLKSLPLAPKYLRLFRRLTVAQETWANGSVRPTFRALIDLTQVPSAWAADRSSESHGSVVTLLCSLWVDLLRASKFKVKSWTGSGATCSASLFFTQRAKAERLAVRHSAFIGNSRLLLGEVPDEWLLAQAQGLLAIDDDAAVIELAPRLIAAVGRPPHWAGLAGLHTLCAAFVRAHRESEANALLSLTPSELDALKPDRLPPFEDGRHDSYRDAPIRAWSAALVELARARERAGNTVGATEALSRAWAVADSGERTKLSKDSDFLRVVSSSAWAW